MAEGLLDFLSGVANQKETGNPLGQSFSGFINKFILSKESVDYYFQFLWYGFEMKTHYVKGSYKPFICSAKYYGEPCSECEKDSGFPADEDGKVKKNKPRRNLYSLIFCHNNNGRTRLSNDGSKLINVSAVSVLETACGEENTQNGYAKDRNIESYKQSLAQDVLYEELFVLRRDNVKKNGKDKSITKVGQMVSGRAKVNFTIDCHEGDDKEFKEKQLKQELLAQELTKNLPEDIREKYSKMSVGEKTGIILSIMDNVKREVWESKGVIFPKLPEKKEVTSDIEKDAED